MSANELLPPQQGQPGTTNGTSDAGLMTGMQRHRSMLLAVLLTSVLGAAAGIGYFQARHLDETTAASPTMPAAQQAGGIQKSDLPAPMQPDRTSGEAAAGAPWPLWEFQLRDPIAPREQALTPLPWRLIGASGLGREWQLIVLRQGKNEPEYFRVGDKLPGNYRIEAISEEDVTLKHGRRSLVLSYIASR